MKHITQKAATLLAILAVVLLGLAGCSSENKAQAPFNSIECAGMNYEDALTQLEEAGFLEITTETVETNSADHDGDVISVTFDGRTSYSSGNKWENTVPVVVKHYVLAQFEATIEITVSGEAGFPVFNIETNLPDKTELLVTLDDGNLYTEQQTVKVKDGVATTEAFTNEWNELVGEYTLTCVMEIEDQAYSVKTKLGTNGECLTGELVEDNEETGDKYLFLEQSYTSDYVPPVAISQAEMDSLIDQTLKAIFDDNYSFELVGYTYNVNIWYDGVAMTATLANIGDVTAIATWEDLRNVTAEASASLYNLLASNGHVDKMASVNILNDINKEYVLLTATLGFVTYDCVSK